MRIFGGRDYYDCGLVYGVDPLITLCRYKDRKVKLTLPSKRVELRGFSPGYPTVDSLTVVFCDKVYRGICATRGYNSAEFIWSADKTREWASKEKNLEIAVNDHWYQRNRTSLEEYFEPELTSPELTDYMISNKLSILVEEPYGVNYQKADIYQQVNPFNLGMLGFAKAIDPYTAFNLLSMWIGGVLGGSSPEMVVITDDKVLAESHGFDKQSFRGPRIK